MGVAGLLCVALAVGHETLGVVWVLPRLDVESLPPTPFGPRSTTLAMIRVTWHVVTIFVLALGGLLLTLASSDGRDAATLLLRWFAVMWFAATAMALFVTARGARSPKAVVRGLLAPVPLLWTVVGAICWAAAA